MKNFPSDVSGYAPGIKSLDEVGKTFFKKVGVVGSIIGFALDLAKAKHEYKKNDGFLKASTIFNLTGSAIVLGLAVAALALPAVAVLGTIATVAAGIWGIIRVVGGKRLDAAIDRRFGPVNVKNGINTVINTVVKPIKKLYEGAKAGVRALVNWSLTYRGQRY